MKPLAAACFGEAQNLAARLRAVIPDDDMSMGIIGILTNIMHGDKKRNLAACDLQNETLSKSVSLEGMELTGQGQNHLVDDTGILRLASSCLFSQ